MIFKVENTVINLNTNLFSNTSGGGWFTYNPDNVNISQNRDGIFVPIVDNVGNTPSERFYRTRDISDNALALSPTNINLDTTIYPADGGFRKEEQAFPLELLFCYPFFIDPNINGADGLPQPNKYITTYNNSEGKPSSINFDKYIGLKRYSSLYALNVKGDTGNFNNINFRDRIVYPETLIVNCVELPPPKQVNNFFDMLSGDNTFVKLVWKGYNFLFKKRRSQLSR